ncbi:MAG TPA: hypothetical protein DCX32_04220 [Candidatus Moranbacteria bacterium]|nr:MAG: Transporter [Parcubacteria group bacterium GW2011_GWC1_45_14]HAV11713.1 hypothetical protein [Candidatus Moranbacteria bacterium]
MKNKNKKTIIGLIWISTIGLFLAIPSFGKAQASDISASEVIKLVNKSRFAEGLNPLSENSVLNKAAKNKADDMLKDDYFAHTSPEGKDPWYWFGKAGYDYKYAGENLAINYSSAKEQHTAWMKSASHKKNILNGNYTQTGVAVMKGKIDGDEVIIAVQLFATPAVAAPLQKEDPVEAMEQIPVQAEKVAEVLPAETSLPKEAVSDFQIPLADNKIENTKVIPETLPYGQNFLRTGIFVAPLLLIVAVLGIFFGKHQVKEQEKIPVSIVTASVESEEAKNPMLLKEEILEKIEQHLKSFDIIKRIRGRPG